GAYRGVHGRLAHQEPRRRPGLHSVRLINGAQNARSSILKRTPLDESELPPAAQELIRRVFGAELGPAEVVDRILRDVRERGDAAIQRYNEEIDGVSAAPGKLPLEVSREEIEK